MAEPGTPGGQRAGGWKDACADDPADHRSGDEVRETRGAST